MILPGYCFQFSLDVVANKEVSFLLFFVLLNCLVEFLICPYVVVFDKDILIGSFVCIYSFKTMTFADTLEIVVTGYLSICLNLISTYYVFGHRRMSLFQRYQFPFLNKKYKLSHEICFKFVKFTHSHPDLTEIHSLIPQYLV